MKVILISTFYKPSVGGVERQVEEIYLNLKKNGVDVKVFCTDASHGSKKRLDSTIKEEDIKRFRYLFGFGYFFRFSPILLFKLLFSKFDIVHVHNSHDAHLLGAILIRLLRRKKLVLTGHNPYVVNKSKRGESLSTFVKIFDFFIKRLSFGINKYIALLNSEKDFVVSHLNLKAQKVEVISNGIRDLYFKEVNKLTENNIFIKKYNLKKDDYKLVLGAMCRMDYVKGIQNLVTAVEENPDCLFLFVGGDGGYLPKLKELYKKSKNVFFTNEFIDTDSSIDFYSFIDIFLLPSVYEPFGLTVVEAMTQGKYILATQVGGPKEIVKDGYSKIIDPDNHKEWSNQIKMLKNNKNLVTESSNKAIIDSKIYSWDNVIKKIINLYKNVLI